MDTHEISACIITKNEESMLGGCLDSIIPYVDEIIVADTGSTDNTVQIAQNAACKVYETRWENDFSKARNFALSKASKPYILVIDADERLAGTPDIKSFIENANYDTAGWLVEVVSQTLRPGGEYDQFSAMLVRFFRKHPQIQYRGAIHEQVADSINAAGFKIAPSPIALDHLGYAVSAEHMAHKQQRNLDMLNEAIKTYPEAYNYYQRAKTYLSLNKLQDALADFEKAIVLSEPHSIVLPQALNYGAIAAYRTADMDRAESWAKRSLELAPGQKFANYIMGEISTYKKRFADAYEFYRKMQANDDQADYRSMAIGEYRLPPEQQYFRLGRSLVGLKMYNEARLEFDRGLKANPDDVSCIVGQANVAFHYKEYDTASYMLQRALHLEPGRQDIQGFYQQVQNAVNAKKKWEQSAASLLSEEMATQQQIEPDIPLLSLSMIVRNEEEMLPDCLESVKGLADEIIVVDTGSMDKTKEIATRYGAKIYDMVWKKDFAAARNESLKRCKGKWVLYMDADERLHPDSRNILRQLLTQTGDDIGGLVVTIESNHVKLNGSTELHRGGYPRLIRNFGYPKIKFEGRVHEQITPSIFALNKSVKLSDIVIEHLGYNQTREVMEAKVKRNYSMLMEHIKEEPLSSYAWYQLGQTLAHMRLFEEAENAIRFAVQMGSLSDSVFASATATLAQLVGNKKNFSEALHWAEQSLTAAPKQQYALNIKAYAQLYLGRPAEAEITFNQVLERLKEARGVPQSGFDISIPEKVVMEGLEKAKQDKMKFS